VEFADYRPYVPGDDLRLVDWNVYGRLRSVLVRLFHEDRNLSLHVLLDASASMGTGERLKSDHGADLAAALALVGLLARDSVTVACAAGEGPHYVVNGHDTHTFASVLSLLERVKPAGTADLHHSLLRLAERRRGDRALLITDLLVDEHEREACLRALAAAAHRPTLLHVLGPEELEPDLSEGLEIEDVETGEVLNIRGGGQAAEAHAAAMRDWLEGIRSRCRALRIQYVPAFTTTPVRGLLTDTLRRARITRGHRGWV
jgi:uncharacterized protein (DUF58 family)